ncbi:TrmH family RNA methyltransferase [Candidatus Sneabacter namystus]|uniref:RNA methyltransferase n=1 Tax=Candidatus Sneabacter namystus TaxID=2601646 RepID=A0A5C0ULK6_9RICK|nr:RNA methyltransferase [Candidatus Sneabacter namystus]QEK39764.1 RNA methyltransferase [Candidatus Sneabacter namystus]
MTEEHLIYGKHAAIACIKNKKRKVVDIFCTSKIFLELRDYILSSNARFRVVENILLQKMTAGNLHQGIVIKVKRKSLLKIPKEARKIAILDRVYDPNNVGAIIRSAVAFGFDTVVVAKDHAVIESGAVAKAASGSLEYINCVIAVNLRNVISQLKNNGFWIVGLDCKGESIVHTTLSEYDKLAVVLGSEGVGIRSLIKSSCDFLLKIDMKKEDVGSINVSNAAAIAFYESSKLRK